MVLATLNAKYSHASFGLRYLYANLGALRERAAILEFEISQRPSDIVERILQLNPTIVGLGVYIWNTDQTREVVALIKRLRPQVTIVLGGPEVSYESQQQEIVGLADYVICGEADLALRELCETLLAGSSPAQKVIFAAVPEPKVLTYPYEYYSEADLKNRIIYVEASRGCPFTCEFCLSSLDIPVRQFDLEPFLGELERLWQRGLRQFKFVDRTFNLNLRNSKTILEFFLNRCEPGMFVHFEMVPDRLPEALRELVKKFPPGSLQFEVGIQSFNPEVGKLISRRQDFEKIADNLRFLRAETGVHVHADLIAGLPGEGLESFAAGFNRLVELDPHEIQVGILKRLRGTPIVRHDAEWEMVYSPYAPYEVLQTKLIDFSTMQRLQRFARYWDLVANSGRFSRTKLLLWERSQKPFESFLAFSDWLYAKIGARHGIAVKSLSEYLFQFATSDLGHSPAEVGPTIVSDLQRCGIEDFAKSLRPFVPEKVRQKTNGSVLLPKRQGRHVAQAQ
ncbi:MAG: B12-binding domain-containing radical SAM protein [Deltaproteobacteria bacterium]|nr:B12-binding domain-containing radical SAM protein [Deltaproteobacteria bacterium]